MIDESKRWPESFPRFRKTPGPLGSVFYYNWRIIAAPHSVIDYVVVHGLCHLVHPDHSRRFWNLLATILPDYPERKAWLKVNGRGLGGLGV